MNLKEQQHQQLWAGLLRGDHKAYTEIISYYFQPVFVYGSRLSKDKDFVKDCVQDVFMELWRRRENLSHVSTVKAYLFTALRFKIYRERKKWQLNEEIDADDVFYTEISIEARLIEDQEKAETKLKIEELLNGLPARQREILYLRFYENLDHQKIAEIMGLNKQTAYNLLYKAIGRLKKDWTLLIALFLSLGIKLNI